jgi:hypothetical protein
METFADIRACGHEPLERALDTFLNMPMQRDSGYGIDLPGIKVKVDPGVSVTGALAPQFGGFLVFECRRRACA